MKNNVDDLIELITSGFNTQETGFNKIDAIFENHEKRIGILEKKTFRTN